MEVIAQRTDMLSTQLIYAIYILTELAAVKPNRNGDRVIQKNSLMDSCDMDKAVARGVLKMLAKYEYVSCTTFGYYKLLKDIKEITLYELCDLFYDGVIIGASSNMMYCRGNYKTNKRYAKLSKWETDLNKRLSSKFKKIIISELSDIDI